MLTDHIRTRTSSVGEHLDLEGDLHDPECDVITAVEPPGGECWLNWGMLEKPPLWEALDAGVSGARLGGTGTEDGDRTGQEARVQRWNVPAEQQKIPEPQ